MSVARTRLILGLVMAALVVAYLMMPKPASAQDPGSPAVVEAEGSCLYLRAGMGLDKAIYDCLADGTGVTVLSPLYAADGYAWAKVRTEAGNVGWVATEFLGPVGTPFSADMEIEAGTRAAVDTGGTCLHLREGPGLGHERLECLVDYTPLLVLGERHEADGYTWLMVQLHDGTAAWVAAEFLVFEGTVDHIPVHAQPDGPAVTQQVIGTSIEGRPIEAFTLGTGPLTIALVGGIHTGPEEVTVHIVHALLEHFELGLDEILEQVSLVFVPNVNPDGYEAGTRVNARGVDLNRNWPTEDWSPVAVHGDTEVSGGTEPLSEPETRALHDFLVELQPDFVLSYHGYAALVEDNNEGVAQVLAAAYADAAGYDHIDEWDFYEITGELIEALRLLGIAAADVELEEGDTEAFNRNLAGVIATMKKLVSLE